MTAAEEPRTGTFRKREPEAPGAVTFRKTLAIDIGGTFIKYGIVEEDGQIRSRSKAPTIEAKTGTEFFDYVAANIPSLEGVELIGVSAPGLVDREFHVRSYAAPKLAALYDTNIAMEMEKRTGISTAAINDAKAAGLCELKMGRARGTKLSAYLIIGTGGGGCICLEDDVFAGADNFAGEFHFMAYHNEKTGEVMKTGRVIGMIGLVNRYNEKAPEDRQVTLGEEITKRAFAGEPLAKEMVDDWIHRIAVQCLSIVVAVNPEILCIGGGISEEDWFMDRVKAEYERISDEHFNHVRFLSTVIDRCQFRNDANLLGAALKANMVYGDL
ncbi:MAG: ROK family protein [Candidatus Limivivens sp.]|nr:ROK family protein [Candidatus Limivivens sp.]